VKAGCNIILMAGQFAQCLAFNEVPVLHCMLPCTPSWAAFYVRLPYSGWFMGDIGIHLHFWVVKGSALKVICVATPPPKKKKNSFFQANTGNLSE